jgi:hypothetical protein
MSQIIRLSLEQKHRFVLAALEPVSSMAQLCRTWHLSRQTGYKWRRRYQRGGLAWIFHKFSVSELAARFWVGGMSGGTVFQNPNGLLAIISLAQAKNPGCQSFFDKAPPAAVDRPAIFKFSPPHRRYVSPAATPNPWPSARTMAVHLAAPEQQVCHA